MIDDTSFLNTIQLNLADRSLRLEYADWLETRNDLRGELIRLEEETIERVAWDDILWQTKPRRRELRQQADARWLRTMGYGQAWEPLLRGHPFPTNVRNAWRLIREAHERWTGELMPDVGGHTDRIAEAERRLGFALPPSVREYIAFAHDLPQDDLGPANLVQVYREFYSMEEMPGQPALSILELFEGDRRWGIPLNRLQHDGPPVHGYTMQPNPDGSYQDFQNEDGSFLSFLFVPINEYPTVPLTRFIFWQAHCYCNFIYGHTGGMTVSVPDAEEARSQLEADFSFHSQFGETTYYETRNFSAFLATPGTRGAAADVMVRPCQPMTEDEMPPCVREWFRADAPCNGYFGDLRYRYTRTRPRR